MELDGGLSEMLDLVDECNILTGKVVTRQKAHAEGLLHRAVYVLLYNSQGELLLQQRHPTKAVCPGMWDLSSAEHLGVGEDYPTAAARYCALLYFLSELIHRVDVLYTTRNMRQFTDVYMTAQ
mmetsp:Transcript_23068/g.32014  ORF Transcript_23068/g.32014 Transcript_23068/m.32014 type:complete len:123 (+) Transcript_23068:157-525(+)